MTRDVPLLHGGDALLLLEALLDALDRVTGFDVDLNLLARQGLHLDHLRGETGGREKKEVGGCQHVWEVLKGGGDKVGET